MTSGRSTSSAAEASIPAASEEPKPLDVAAIRADFPILEREIRGKRLVYLDSAATSQKPRVVIDALSRFYETHNANVHRGVYTLAQEATDDFEATRVRVAEFIGGVDSKNIVFTMGTTAAINLVAWGWGSRTLKEGDEVLLTQMEHHSNLVPWILVAKQTGARLRHIPVNDDGSLNMESLDELITDRTKIVSLVHKSNVLGTVNPVRTIADRAHEKGAVVMVDGAQSAPHMRLNPSALGCDFLAFSSHKMLGPTGVGVLYGTPEMLEKMEPVWGGGEMILEVKLDDASWADVPHKFEPGTPNIADVVAFRHALDYLDSIGMEAIHAHDERLTKYAMEKLQELDFLRVLGDPLRNGGGVISFVDKDLHPHDIATVVDGMGIAVRVGHHCAMPLMRRFAVPATTRASFYIYNDTDDVDALVEGLLETRRYFGHECP